MASETSVLEKHFHTGALTILLALVLWFGDTVSKNDKSLAVVVATQNTILSQVDNLGKDRYTGSQAASDRARAQTELTDIKGDIAELKQRMRAVEMDQGNGSGGNR